MIRTIIEAEEYMSRFYEKVRQTTGTGATVDRMWPLLQKVGNPHLSLRVVHIAGTSGKTSTAYFMSTLLTQAGKRVGLTVSPHISSIAERLQLDSVPVTDQKFCEYLNEFTAVMGPDPDASYFEYLIVFVLWVFALEGVDYAVLETGLGGLHDGTNVCQRADKVCVITDIGLDHQAILGSTITEIAMQKAGIIHSDNDVFMYSQSDEVNEVFETYASKQKATLHIIDPLRSDDSLYSGLVDFQKRNWHLALETYAFLKLRDNLPALTREQLIATQIAVPGRMQTVTTKSQQFILDGAHNAQKMQAFVASFRRKYPDIKVPVLLAMKEGKDYQDVIQVLQPILSSVLCVGFERSQDIPAASIDPEALARTCRQLGIEARTEQDIEHALYVLQQENEPVVVVTGSFYVLGDVLRLITRVE